MGIFLTGLLLVPLLSTSPTVRDSLLQTGPDGLPIPKASMEVSFAEDFSLAQLIEAYCEVTGARILSVSSVQKRTQAVEICGFGGALTVAPEDIQTFFEGILSNNDFRLSLRSTQAVTTFDLYHSDTSDRGSGGKSWHLVPEEDLDMWADNSAMLIATTLELEGIDARQLSTNLRPLLADPLWNSILNMSNSNGLILRGTGSQLAAIARMVNNMDEKAVEARAQIPSRVVVAPSNVPKTEKAAPVLVAPTEPVPTPLAERPHLVTTVIETEGDIQGILNVVQSLSSNRHSAENAHRIWFVGDDAAQVMWPKPRVTMIYNRNSGTPSGEGKLVIQATQEDTDWIVKLEKLVSGLSE